MVGVKMRMAASADAPVGRQDERALGQVRLPRQRLHQCGIDGVGVGEDRERVARQRPVGEHVTKDVADFAHARSGRRRRRRLSSSLV